MSGGSHDHAYLKLNEIAKEFFPEPIDHLESRKKVADILERVSVICHDIEWIDSGDYGEEDWLEVDKMLDTIILLNFMDYKVETKMGTWEATLTCGEYSGKEEKHLFFSANNEEEVWYFLCRYVEDQNLKANKAYKHRISGCSLGEEDFYAFLLKYENNNKTYISPLSKEKDITRAYPNEICYVDIKPLNVIYFAK